MRKFFIFAIALAASAMTFTACDGNNPTDPETTDVNPADYINTMWRIDSCKVGNEKQRPPHGIFRIMDDKQFTFDGDTLSYAFNDGKLVIGEEELTIVGVKKGWAHLSGRGADIYMCQLPELDMDNLIMEHQASDFVGTWKHAYYAYDNHNPGYEWHREGSNPWVETWEFKEDGTCIYTDYFTGETVTGTWECDPYQIKFTRNPAEGTVIPEGEPITVQPLTKNWMSILRSPDGFQYYYYWFYRVK